MQFLKMLLLALTVGFAVAFAINNWTWVSLQLWGGLIADVNLPLLMLAVFLLGLVPMWIAFQATRWRLRQRIATCERTIADLRVAGAPATAALVTPVIVSEPASVAQPVASDFVAPSSGAATGSENSTTAETRL